MRPTATPEPVFLTSQPAFEFSSPGSLLGRDQEVAAAILLPAGLGLFRAERLLLSLADNRDAVGGQPQADDVVADGGGTTFAERQVVLVGAPVVGVSLDHHLRRRPPLHPLHVLLERRAGGVVQFG